VGSNPISSTSLLTLVVDSPPLQALHRCGALGILVRAHRAVTVPRSIAIETARSRAIEGGGRVPDLADHPALAVRDVADELLTAAGALLVGEVRATTEYRLDGHRIDRPELDVILLARDLGAVALVEDKAAIRVSRKLDVPVVGTAEVLCDLEVRGLLDDAVLAAQAIRATKYLTKDLILLASGTRRRHWQAELTAGPGR
jgi:predicted nucleic acid-binding protein